MSSSVFPGGGVDTFTTMNDISASDATNVATYQQLLLATNLSPSQQAQLTSLTQTLTSQGKILSSSQINHLSDAIVAVESYFLNTVNSDINNMEAEFAAKVAKFSNQGIYNPATTYMDMNFVTWNNQSYICTVDNTLNIDPSHTSNWVLVAAQGATGPQGQPGAALSYIGTYSSLSTYQANQLVSYNGSTYICTQNNTTNQTPTNTAYWTLFVTGATPLAQSTAPTSPVTNQLWINTTTGVIEYWNGTTWVTVEASGINDGTINVIPSQFGTIGNLVTTAKSDLVSAINEVKNETNTNQTNITTNTSNIGTLTNLATTVKSNLVAAINEVKSEAGVTSVNGNTGAITEVNMTLFQVRNIEVTTTSAQQIINFTPTTSGIYSIKSYLRVVASTTNVTFTITYADSGGAQSYTPPTINNQSLSVGSHSVISYDFEAVAGTAITLTVTAGTANQVYVTAALVEVA